MKKINGFKVTAKKIFNQKKEMEIEKGVGGGGGGEETTVQGY